MRPIFRQVMDGVELPPPWMPTHMKSYAKGRAPHRIWSRMVTNKESDREHMKAKRTERKKINAVLRQVATDAGVSMKQVREYVIKLFEEGR